MERLDRTATSALRTLLEAQPTTLAKVTFAWTLAAGPSIAQATTVSWSDDGVLRVEAKNEMWRTEVGRARPVIQHRLAQILGEDAVRRVVVEGDTFIRRGSKR